MTSQQPEHGVLGTLWLVAKKTGMDMQSFPIDAERVTIGRDYDSDIRLYFSDVSKLHCEIVFDEPTGQAHLHVHGTHGLKYASHGGEMSTYKPPAVIALSDKDTFIVRKKLFRFEYGHEEIQVETPPSNTVALPADSPLKAPASSKPSLATRRKRVSYRMSLVPSGKPFEPLASPIKSRRHSIIGLDAGPQYVLTPKKKSGLVNQIQEEEEQHEEEEEEVVIEAINGEEGDVLYVEERESEEIEPKAIHQNPFMTPQQKRKAPLRNTSAVPRTRKAESFGDSRTEIQQEDADSAEAGTESPKTPRSVPLPQGGETPYNSQNGTPAQVESTPRSVPLPPVSNTPYNVPAQVAMSTPRGPLSLHKALLLRSARKAWQSSQAQGIEGAIQNGDVTVRRKSLSPQTRGSRKSLPAMPEATQVDDDEQEDAESDEEEYEEASPSRAPRELEWVYEDGHAQTSLDESDSSIDSLEADQSMEIPGQGVIAFSPQANHTGSVPEVEHELSGEYEEEEVGEAQYEEEEEEASYGDEKAMMMENDDIHDEQEPEEEEELDEADEPAGTPVVQRSLDRFYTPQPQRSLVTDAPRTLSSIGGPAVRFQRMPETPSAGIRRVAPTPGSLGAPSRRIIQPVVQDTDVDEESVGPSTPVKREVDPAVLEEAKRRRETLGTPRNLPAPPRSFKTPVREFSLRNPNKAAPHPALAIHSPEQGDEAEGVGPSVPLDPIEAVQRRLDGLRRQSIKRQSVDASRRATVGFALPSTPARSHSKPSAAYTVLGNRTATAVVHEQDEELSLPPTPTAAAPNVEEMVSVLGQLGQLGETPQPAASTPVAQQAVSNGPATPQFGGMKEMFRSVLPPKTPSFAGVRSMFASEQAAPAPTPRYGGMRTMFREPQTSSTPQMAGIRDMYQLPQDPATPVMDGLREMYELDEVEQEASLQADPETSSEEEEEFEGDSEVIVLGTPEPEASAPAKGKSSSNDAPPPIKAARSKVSKLPTASAPARKVSASTAPPKSKAASAPAPTATRKAAPSTSTTRTKSAISETTVAKRSAPAATKRAVPVVMIANPRPGDIDYFSESEIEEPLEYEAPPPKKAEPVKPARSTTSRAKKTESAAPKDVASKPTRGKKAVLGENDDQPEVSSIPVPAPAKAIRARKVTAPATKATETKTTTKSASTSTKTGTASAPVRRTRTVTAEKENAPEEPVVKKAPVKRTVKKVEPKVTDEPVVTARATRSRK